MTLKRNSLSIHDELSKLAIKKPQPVKGHLLKNATIRNGLKQLASYNGEKD